MLCIKIFFVTIARYRFFRRIFAAEEASMLSYVRLYRDRGLKEEYRQVEVPAACSLSVGLIVPRDIARAIFCSKERKREIERKKDFFSSFSFLPVSLLFISLTKLLFEIEEFLMNFRLRIISSIVLALVVVVVSRL